MTTEQLRHRMSPILKALKERSCAGAHRWRACAAPNAPTTAGTPYTPMPQAGSPLPPRRRFRRLEAHHCFKGTVTLPEASAGKTRGLSGIHRRLRYLEQQQSPVSGLWDGRLVCGLDVNHNEFDLAACAVPGESHELALYVYCNTPARDVFLRVETAERDDDVTGLFTMTCAPRTRCARFLRMTTRVPSAS